MKVGTVPSKIANITLQPTALIGKHFAKMKSKMLTNESCG